MRQTIADRWAGRFNRKRIYSIVINLTILMLARMVLVSNLKIIQTVGTSPAPTLVSGVPANDQWTPVIQQFSGVDMVPEAHPLRHDFVSLNRSGLMNNHSLKGVSGSFSTQKLRDTAKNLFSEYL
ncbi:MAG TPA: hypothetical protein VHL11_23040 [Phototrophicaceae bacterium]|jgi:hypothetical protein|nr:hypothetical protein [Phototrophicaceae bacterium]